MQSTEINVRSGIQITLQFFHSFSSCFFVYRSSKDRISCIFASLTMSYIDWQSLARISLSWRSRLQVSETTVVCVFSTEFYQLYDDMLFFLNFSKKIRTFFENVGFPLNVQLATFRHSFRNELLYFVLSEIFCYVQVVSVYVCV